MITKGTILKCNSQNIDDYFFDTVVVISDVNEEGCIGFILNHRFDRYFNELVEFADSPPFPLREGGPVEHEKLFFMHNRPDLIEDSIQLKDGLFYGGNFQLAVSYLKMGMLDEQSLKMFIGYCGWDAGQLEEEIKLGEWTLLEEYDFFGK